MFVVLRVLIKSKSVQSNGRVVKQRRFINSRNAVASGEADICSKEDNDEQQNRVSLLELGILQSLEEVCREQVCSVVFQTHAAPAKDFII